MEISHSNGKPIGEISVEFYESSIRNWWRMMKGDFTIDLLKTKTWFAAVCPINPSKNGNVGQTHTVGQSSYDQPSNMGFEQKLQQ